MTVSIARSPATKVLDWSGAKQWRAAARGRVVFTNGVFDLLHTGHVDLLLGARQAGDCLIVAINSDSSVKRLKGLARPIRTESERAYVVAAFEMVDRVVVFEQDTPLELIRALRPDVLAKGGDYDESTMVGASELRSWGGDVRVVPFTPGQSTTHLIQMLRDESSR